MFVYLCSEFADAFGGGAYIQVAGFQGFALGDQGSGADYAAFGYEDIVHDYGGHAYQAGVFYCAAVQDYPVAYRYIVAYDDFGGRGVWGLVIYMQDGAVLDVATLAYGDGVDIAAEHGHGPDGGVFAYGDIADYQGGFIHPGCGVDVWGDVVEGSDCHGGGV